MQLNAISTGLVAALIILASVCKPAAAVAATSDFRLYLNESCIREAGFDGRTKNGDFREHAVFTSVTYTATRALGVQLKQSASTTAEAPSERSILAASAAADDEIEPPPSAMYASTLEITVVK